MNDDSGQFKPPPVGSFPFFEKGVELASIWTRGMLGQANLWNQEWAKLKEGRYQAQDWAKALVSSTELSASMLGELFSHAAGDLSPPLCSLRGNSKDEVRVQLRVSLGQDDTLSVSDLARLGPPQSGPSPVVKVTRLDDESRVIKVWLDGEARDFPAGQYLGLVMRSTSPEPIAIVTVSHDSTTEPATAGES